MATAPQVIPAEYIQFAKEARDAQASFTNAKAWARAYARKFYHQVSDSPGFLPIYQTLLSMSNLPVPAAKKKYPTFEDNFDEEFEKALLTTDSYADLDKWARAEATRMYWVFERQTKWKTIYDAIFDNAMRFIHGTQTKSLTSSKNSFAEDGHPTEAEQEAGRNELNQILHKEFNTWWDAFVAEAAEDDEPLTAEDRFCLHAAQQLRKKTGLPVDDLILVVGVWIQGRLDADE